MSSILLQLETALADARASQERAAEKLHDAGVAKALAQSQYDAAAEIVKRTEGALNALHGVAAAPSAPIIAAPAREPRKPKAEPEGPECPGCGDKGTLSHIMRGTVRFAQCSACKGEFPS
jgi:formate dehydrogenase maturation protein FdhE